ncbi:hypothetical protein [Mesobacillus foraminis]|uniref:Uncharacterized protein n=1 Tax=Mesobacillus foraminis TaxID=279826 RepID=A0A4V2RDU4_9BACI|nr:hypothetical protein [Mesobacillus foraminis]TCN26170.1 hypothetical protein EV146_104278 [Mesobacillus foraminis]
MFILQICNTFSQEILHQQVYEHPYTIEGLLETVIDWQDWYIYDDKKRTFKGDYVRHSIVKQGDKTFYKLYFNVKPAKLKENA